MSDIRQLPLFNANPQSPKDINRYTPFNATYDLFAEHLVKAGKSEHTVKAFVADLRLVGEALDEELPVGEFTTSNLNRFLHWLEYERGVPCSRKSYARRVTTLKVYFKWLKGLGAIPIDPAKVVLQRSGPAPLQPVLSEREIRAAVDFSRTLKKGEVQDYRAEFVLRLLLDTGVKKSETMRLTPASFDRLNSNQPFLVIKHKARNVYKERRIDLDPDLMKLYDLYMQQYHPERTIFNCTSRNLEYILTAIGEGAGISHKLSFEMLRWTSAVRDHRRGMEDDDLREKMGLSKVSWSETGRKIRALALQLAEDSEKHRASADDQ